MSAIKRLRLGLAFVCATGWASVAHAQLGDGTWERTDAQGKGITMTVETCCNGGRRLIYHIPAMGGQPASTMSVDSPMDGTDVPTMVGGKPTGQTMAIKRVDDRHYTAVMKVKGQRFGTSSGVISADGKAMSVESVMDGGAETPLKITETWVKK